jgi:hypothetical protein
MFTGSTSEVVFCFISEGFSELIVTVEAVASSLKGDRVRGTRCAEDCDESEDSE